MKAEIHNGNTFTNSPLTIGNGNKIMNVVNQGNNELDNIINGIMKDLSGLGKEQAESIKDAVDMIKDELAQPEPRKNILRNGLTLIASMFTVANGIPTLVSNLQKLADYITPYIRN